MPAYKYPLLIKDLLRMALIKRPDQEIVYRDMVRFNYRTLNERINRFGNALGKSGVKPGDVVAVIDYDSHRYLESFFAIPMFGGVLHTVNWRLSPEQVLYTMNRADDRIVLVNADFLPLVESFADRLTTVEKFILLTDEKKKPDSRLSIELEYEQMLRDSSPYYDFPDLDEDTVATTFYTTGTEGPPKGVCFTHRQLVLHTLGVATALSGLNFMKIDTSKEVYMPLTPMFHANAWGQPYVATLSAIKQVYPGKYDVFTLLNLIKKEKVTITHCVPTILDILLLGVEMEKVDLSGLKMGIGGAALPKGLARRALNAGITCWSAYGLSETCPVVTMSDLKDYMMDWDTDRKMDVLQGQGMPIPLVQMEVMDEEGRILPHDGRSTGEIVLRAPWLTKGYTKDPGRTEQLWRNGWMHTGDLGNIDEEGYLHLTDRIKDVIKSGGEWISTLTLENLLSNYEAIAQVGVIGIADERWGERPLAVLVLKSEYKDKFSPEDVKQYLQQFVDNGTISKWAVPDRFDIVDQLPQTAAAKVDKKVLRKKYQAGK